MRRALTVILAAAAVCVGISSLPEQALAGDRDRYESGYDRDCRCDRSRRGYWERPGDRRRVGHRYYRRPRSEEGTHYYPGYGYYPDRGAYEGGHHGGSRSEWCARRYRSYDWRSGTYVTYDGVRRYCG